MTRMWSCVAVLMLIGMPARPADARQAGDPPAVRYELADPASGTAFRVYRADPEDALFEIRGGDVTVRRHVTRRVSTTAITAGREALTLTSSAEGIRLAGPQGVLIARPGDRAAGEAIRDHLRGSAAMDAAMTVLSRLAGSVSAPVAHVVSSTRHVLGALSGQPVPRPRLTFDRSVRPRARLASTRIQTTPGECWDIYAEEAIEIWMEYEDCVDTREWYDLIGYTACASVYDLRAIAAFSWYLKCTAIRA